MWEITNLNVCMQQKRLNCGNTWRDVGCANHMICHMQISSQNARPAFISRDGSGYQKNMRPS